MFTLQHQTIKIVHEHLFMSYMRHYQLLVGLHVSVDLLFCGGHNYFWNKRSKCKTDPVIKKHQIESYYSAKFAALDKRTRSNLFRCSRQPAKILSTTRQTECLHNTDIKWNQINIKKWHKMFATHMLFEEQRDWGCKWAPQKPKMKMECLNKVCRWIHAAGEECVNSRL